MCGSLDNSISHLTLSHSLVDVWVVQSCCWLSLLACICVFVCHINTGKECKRLVKQRNAATQSLGWLSIPCARTTHALLQLAFKSLHTQATCAQNNPQPSAISKTHRMSYTRAHGSAAPTAKCQGSRGLMWMAFSPTTCGCVI